MGRTWTFVATAVLAAAIVIGANLAFRSDDLYDGSECALGDGRGPHDSGWIDCVRDGDGWLLEGVEAAGDVTLRVLSGGHVTLRDVHVTRAGDVRLDIGCACAIRGEGFTVDGTGVAGAQVWLHSSNLEGSGRPALRSVSLDGLAAKGLDRFEVSDVEGAVAVSNLTLECAPSAAGIQLDGEAVTAAFVLRDVRTAGCARVSASQRDAPPAAPPLQIVLVRANLTGSGLDDGSNDGIGATARTRYAVALLDSSISGARYAVDIDEGSSLRMERSRLERNVHAIGLSGGGTVAMNDSVVADNGNGIRVWDGSSIRVERSTFLRNGAGALRGCGAAIEGDVTGSVHSSVFSGNGVAVSVASDPMDEPFDARDNYWGSPTGPSLVPACRPPGMGGDTVEGAVAVVPFRTSPP